MKRKRFLVGFVLVGVIFGDTSHYKEDIDILCDVVYEVKKGMLKKIR